jgi:hypothetical protein
VLMFEEFSESFEESFEFFSRAGSRVVDADEGCEHKSIIERVGLKVNTS